MNILLTGASSFTGYWFARELARAGHAVTAALLREPGAYTGVRGARVQMLHEYVRVIGGCRFGEGAFQRVLAEEGPWDVLCHHAADVSDYKSPAFDYAAALRANTCGVDPVLRAFREGGGRRVVLTGSVFEAHEGAGSLPRRAFSPYGLSKGLTADVFRYFADVHQLRLAKFVIANPFGPYEEPRFTAYLVKSWRAGQTAVVNTPAYVRDNIHVSLLARAYAQFVGGVGGEPGYEAFHPSQYVETQGAFAERFARELAPRLRLACPLELREQTEFGEPRVRINTDALDAAALGWNEGDAWDELARYYCEST